MLSAIDVWARDASQGLARVTAGQVPNSSGTTIVTTVTPSGNVAFWDQAQTWTGAQQFNAQIIFVGGLLTNDITIASAWTIDGHGIHDAINLFDSGTFNEAILSFAGVPSGKTYSFAPSAGVLVPVGTGAAAAGALGAISLTGQTGSLAAQTLLTGTATSAGLYRVSFYVKTTTAGAALDAMTVTLAWNDGTAQTLVVPFVSALALTNNHDLATLNAFSQTEIVVKAAASQNVSFTTTVTKTGSPQYSIDARIEALG
jgi:hypothetical protein